MDRKKLGRLAEVIAARFLKRKGFRIIEKNFFCRFGEMDIVAKDGDETVFVEVRSSTDYHFADPLESIRDIKVKRLKRIALAWLNLRKIPECNMRFDAIAIVFKGRAGEAVLEKFLYKNRYLEIRHIKSIF